MDKKLPVYKLVISESVENGGVNYVALTDDPAIQTNWFAFDKHIKFATQPDRQIVTMPLIIADLPIYRRDKERGEFYVIIEGEEVEKVQNLFMKKGFLANVNEQHNPNKKVKGVYLINSFVSDKQMGIQAPEMFKDLPYKTWYGSYKFEDTAYWNEMIKSGNFTGVSVEGMFDMVDEQAEFEKKILKEVKNILS